MFGQEAAAAAVKSFLGIQTGGGVMLGASGEEDDAQ